MNYVYVNKKKYNLPTTTGNPLKADIIKELQRRVKLGRFLYYQEKWTKEKLCEVLRDDEALIRNETGSTGNRLKLEIFNEGKKEEKKEKTPSQKFANDLQLALKNDKLQPGNNSIIVKATDNTFHVYSLDGKEQKIDIFNKLNQERGYEPVYFQFLETDILLVVERGAPGPGGGRVYILNVSTGNRLIANDIVGDLNDIKSIDLIGGYHQGAVVLSREEIYFYTSLSGYLWNYSKGLEIKHVINNVGPFPFHINSYIQHPKNPRIVISPYVSAGGARQILLFINVDERKEIEREIPSVVLIFRLFNIGKNKLLGIGSGIVLFEFIYADPYKFKTAVISDHWVHLTQQGRVIADLDHSYFLSSLIKLKDDMFVIGTERQDYNFYLLDLSIKVLTRLYISRANFAGYDINKIGKPNLIKINESTFAVTAQDDNTTVYLIDYSNLKLMKYTTESKMQLDQYFGYGHDTIGSFSTANVQQMQVFNHRNQDYLQALDMLSNYFIDNRYLSKNLANIVRKFL